MGAASHRFHCIRFILTGYAMLVPHQCSTLVPHTIPCFAVKVDLALKRRSNTTLHSEMQFCICTKKIPTISRKESLMVFHRNQYVVGFQLQKIYLQHTGSLQVGIATEICAHAPAGANVGEISTTCNDRNMIERLKCNAWGQ